MRKLLPILIVWGCSNSPPPPAMPDGVEEEVPQATFVVGTRTAFEGPLTKTFEDGSQLEITQWTVVLSAVEIHLCETASVWELLVPNAWAHVSNSTTRLGTPSAEDLTMGTGGARIVGEIAPPLGTYCRAYAIYTPADDDVLNFGRVSEADLLGKTAVIEAQWTPAGQPTQSLTWAWAGTRAVAIELEPTTMQTPNDHEQLLVDKRIDARILDGLTREHMDDDPAAVLMAAFFDRVDLYRTAKR
ncbi:MAG: hypothetical protein R3E66_03545 [bacterium]